MVQGGWRWQSVLWLLQYRNWALTNLYQLKYFEMRLKLAIRSETNWFWFLLFETINVIFSCTKLWHSTCNILDHHGFQPSGWLLPYRYPKNYKFNDSNFDKMVINYSLVVAFDLVMTGIRNSISDGMIEWSKDFWQWHLIVDGMIEWRLVTCILILDCSLVLILLVPLWLAYSYWLLIRIFIGIKWDKTQFVYIQR